MLGWCSFKRPALPRRNQGAFWARRKCRSCREGEKIHRVQNWAIQHGWWQFKGHVSIIEGGRPGGLQNGQTFRVETQPRTGGKWRLLWAVQDRMNVQTTTKEYFITEIQWGLWRWWKWSGKSMHIYNEAARSSNQNKWTPGRSQRKHVNSRQPMW